MKIVLAPDSFKGAMRSNDICAVLSDELLKIDHSLVIESIPMADGGEGTVEAVSSLPGTELVKVEVTGPLGEKVMAEYALINNGKTAVMEMASASGLEILPEKRRNPMKTTTFGTGEILRKILLSGVKEVVVGIGGSATVDGGIGMAQALGYKLLDSQGNSVASGGDGLLELASIDSSDVIKELSEARIRVACDVTNPLTGEFGAARVYGPQKGATPEMVELLEKGLKNLHNQWMIYGKMASKLPGDGAAGGLGAGLRAFCNAEIVSGAKLIAEVTGLEEHIKTADLVITGEGKTDHQTFQGKLPQIIAKMAQKYQVPVILLSGLVEAGNAVLSENFFKWFSISDGCENLEQAIADTEKNLRKVIRNNPNLFVNH